jgi:O-antigen ligase
VTPLSTASRPAPLASAIALLAAFGAFLGAVGITQSMAFQQPSPLKYGITIGAPLLVMLAATVRRPLTVFAPVIVVAAPFASFQAFVGGYSIPLLLPLVGMAAVAACFDGNARSDLTLLGGAAVIAGPLLLVPIIDGTQVRDFVESLLSLLLVAWIVARTAREPGGMTLIIGAIITGALLQSAIAIWEARTGSRLNLYSGAGTQVFGNQYFYSFDDTNRPVGSLFDPISLGNVLAIAGPLIVAMGARVRGNLRWMLAAGGVVLSLALALSLSRMAWIGFFAGTIVALLLLPRRERRLVGAACAIAAVVVVFLALTLGGAGLRTRFDTLRNPTDTQYSTGTGDQRRIAIWGAALAVFSEHPVAGVGVGHLEGEIQRRVANVGTYTHAHSTYFQMIGEAGVLGLALLAVFLAGLAEALRTVLRRDRVLGAGLAGSVVALLICWTTDWVIIYPNVSASVGALLGLVAAAGQRSASRGAVTS